MSKVSGPVLLSRLKDIQQCDDELAILVRRTVLEPFQPNLSEITSKKRPSKPSSAEFREMATQLGKLAMEIVNQNINTLRDMKVLRKQQSGEYQNAIKCLIDSACYAISSLKHMKAYTALKPLDIEKTTSNLVCRIVDLGEYTRALDELTKLRSTLASVANLQLDRIQPYESISGEKSPTPPSSPRRFQTASPNRKQGSDFFSTANAAQRIFGPDTSTIPAADAYILKKYADLLIYPLDTTINDPSTVLLILACQINTIRCLIDINNGNILQYLYALLNREGNIIDWCRHLQNIDAVRASKQFETVNRLLSKAASKLPPSDDAPLHSFALQCLAIKASYYGNISSKKCLCDRIVQMAIAYEKSSVQVDYPILQRMCYSLAKIIEPSISDLAELDAYFTLCEYCAYTARKYKAFSATINAYQQMMLVIEKIAEEGRNQNYYLITQLAISKLATGAAQLERVILGDSYNGVESTLSDIELTLQTLSDVIENAQPQDEYSAQATFSFCKCVDSFRSSCNRFYEFIEKKVKRTKEVTKNLPPNAMAQSEDWEATLEKVCSCLHICGEILPCSLQIMTKKTCASQSRSLPMSPNEVLLTFVDIMVLMSRLLFDVDDEDSYSQAYEYLSTGEQLSAEFGYTGGYRWLSGAFYMIGVALFNAGQYEAANYPLRKACALLEKDSDRAATDAGKLQLCRRYEILGTSCNRSKHFEDAAKAFRLALKRLPASSISAFVQEYNKLSLYGLIEKNPFVPKLIERFLRASVVDDDMPQVDFAHDMMNLDHLQPSEKCIIYECELKVLHILSSKYDCNRQQIVLVTALLRNYDSLNFPLRRARVLLDRVRIELSVKGSRELAVYRAMDAATEASVLLQSESYGKDSALLQYRQHYLALSLSWRGICAKEQGDEMPKAFNIALQHWGMLLKNLGSIYAGPPAKEILQQLCAQVDDLDRLYDHLRMLADFFGVNHQLIHQISTLRLMLKLNNGLRSATSDHITESILISSQIGRIYSDLGYSGKAAIEFSQAKSAIQTGKASPDAEITYLVLYARHLAKLGNLDKSQSVFNTAQKVWESLLQPTYENTCRKARLEMSQRLIVADAYLTRSFISMHTETLNAAIDDCTAGLRILNSCTRIVRQQIDARTTERSTRLEDPFQSKPAGGSSEQGKSTALASSLAFKESEWTIAQKMNVCLQQLANLHLTRGSWRDGKYYLEKGRDLADQLNAALLKFNFLLSLSNCHLRSGSIEDSKKDLETAVQLLPQGHCYLQEEARFKMAVGEVDAWQNFIDDALQSFDSAHELFTKVTDKGYIASIEKLVESQDVQNTISDAGQLLSMETKTKNDIQFECRPLRNMQAMNVIRKALALVANDSIAEGLALLEKLEESSAVILDELQLSAAISRSRAQSIKHELADNILCSEAHILPSFAAKQTKPSIMKKTTSAQNLRLLRDNLNFTMERLLETHRRGADKAPIRLLQEICLDSGSMMFLKNFFASSGRILMNNYAALSTYYLEMSKSLSIRREMQRCLVAKLDPQAKNKDAEIQWPKAFSEHGEELNNGPTEMDLDEENLGMISGVPDWIPAHLSTLQAAYAEEHELDDKEFQDKFVDILPENWTVCSITMDTSSNHMCIGRLRSGQTPLVVKIPLQRAAHRSSQKESISLEDVINELRDIIRQSDETIHNSQKYAQKKNAEQWWKIRIQLDRRLKKLLEVVEEQWFGGFKGLLGGRYCEDEDELSKFQEIVCDLLFETVSKQGKQKINKRLDLDLEACRMILRLGPEPRDFEMEDVIYFLLASHEIHDISVDYESIDITMLISKLKTAINNYHHNAKSAGINSMQKLPDDHVILILDKHVHMLPLESMATLRSQAVSRLPCLSFLRDRILYLQAAAEANQNESDWARFAIDKKSTYYILNPSGDLKHTQEEFEQVFERMDGWNGIVEEKPLEFRWASTVQRHQLYMYFGHSGGESMIRGQSVRKMKHCPVTILMGCSSGAVHPRGEFDADGNVTNYLLAGSPSVVGNLWDVTDKSIDQLTKKMLEEWGILAENKHISIAEAISAARDHCSLPFLIGAAPVVYGIPTYIK